MDLKTGQFSYCNAAHTTSLILKEDGSLSELSNTHGLPLGLYTNREYDESAIELSKNDILFLYTDGVTDTINMEGINFGETRLKEELINLKGNTPNQIIRSIEKTLKLYRNGAKQIDDYSIVVFKYQPK